MLFEIFFVSLSVNVSFKIMGVIMKFAKRAAMQKSILSEFIKA